MTLCAVLMQTEEADKQEAARIEKDGQAVSPNVYYMRQTVGTAAPLAKFKCIAKF